MQKAWLKCKRKSCTWWKQTTAKNAKNCRLWHLNWVAFTIVCSVWQWEVGASLQVHSQLQTAAVHSQQHRHHRSAGDVIFMFLPGDSCVECNPVCVLLRWVWKKTWDSVSVEWFTLRPGITRNKIGPMGNRRMSHLWLLPLFLLCVNNTVDNSGCHWQVATRHAL